MNTFAAKKYHYYCALDSVYLQLHVCGSYHLEIIGSKRVDGKPRQDEVLFPERFAGKSNKKLLIYQHFSNQQIIYETI